MKKIVPALLGGNVAVNEFIYADFYQFSQYFVLLKSFRY